MIFLEKKIPQAHWPSGESVLQPTRRLYPMTITSNPPPDREEHVEVVSQPGEYEQRRVVRNTAADRQAALSRLTQVIWLLFGFVEALIAIRIVLKLIGANPGAFFTYLIYSVTDVFLWPFAGITPTPGVGAFQFEISSLIAILVYALVAWGVTRLVWVLFYHPETTTVTSYRNERY
jgi:hypothetical protein